MGLFFSLFSSIENICYKKIYNIPIIGPDETEIMVLICKLRQELNLTPLPLSIGLRYEVTYKKLLINQGFNF